MAYRHKSYTDKLFIRINRAILCRQEPCPHSDDSSRDELIFRGPMPTRNFYLLLPNTCMLMDYGPRGNITRKDLSRLAAWPTLRGANRRGLAILAGLPKNSAERGSTRLTWGVLFFPRTTLESPPQQR